MLRRRRFPLSHALPLPRDVCIKPSASNPTGETVSASTGVIHADSIKRRIDPRMKDLFTLYSSIPINQAATQPVKKF